jgi:hypothetical protein
VFVYLIAENDGMTKGDGQAQPSRHKWTNTSCDRRNRREVAAEIDKAKQLLDSAISQASSSDQGQSSRNALRAEGSAPHRAQILNSKRTQAVAYLLWYGLAA